MNRLALFLVIFYDIHGKRRKPGPGLMSSKQVTIILIITINNTTDTIVTTIVITSLIIHIPTIPVLRIVISITTTISLSNKE